MSHTRIGAVQQGGHVHTSWWSGRSAESTHGKNGDLVFTLDEWLDLRKLLVGQTVELKEELYPEATPRTDEDEEAIDRRYVAKERRP